MRAMLKVHHLSYSRNQKRVLAPLGFSVSEGETMFVVGVNGSGKSTLLRLLAGLLPWPQNAAMSWFDQAFEAQAASPPVRTAYLGHQLGLKEALSAAENLRFAGSLSGRPQRRGQIATALEMVGLVNYQNTVLGRMSAGQRKRVGLARLLIQDGEFWLLDEPFLLW